MTRKIRFGLQTAPQNTTWQELRATWKLIVSWAGAALVTDSRDEKDELLRRFAAAFGITPEQYELGALVGSASEVRDRIAQFIDVGVTHFIPIANTPFNHESIRRFAEEVIPAFRS